MEIVRKKDTKSVYFWNMIASISYSFQSVFILIVLARACDIVAAGMFLIAWTTGNLMVLIGKYGIRNFQVSDVKNAYEFEDYLGARVITSIFMIVALGIYIIFSSTVLGYTIEKTSITIIICLMKGIDAVEDVYHGHYQKNENLEIASKMLFARIAITTIIMCIVAVITADLMAASVIGTIVTVAFFIFSIIFVGRKYYYPIFLPIKKESIKKIIQLLKTTFPLFVSTFLLFYICNAPRYGIDAYMSDVEQAYYGYIAMPAFIVGLFATFIYNPIIVKISKDWDNGEIKTFVLEFFKQVLIIIGLTIVFVGVMFTIGIPILNLLYDTNLNDYVIESVVLMTAGGFLAIASLISIGITIIRKQSIMLPIYAITTVVSVVINGFLVSNWGIMGAAIEYLILTVILSAMLSIYFLLKVTKIRKDNQNG